MNVATAPRSKERKTDRYDSRLKIKTYDNDNLYPQNILSIVRASAIGSTCLDRFIDFIEGNGIRSSELSDYVVNSKHQTMDDIHHLCCVDIGSFGGFALHVNYDIFCRPCEIQSIPFEACRLEEPDDDGRSQPCHGASRLERPVDTQRQEALRQRRDRRHHRRMEPRTRSRESADGACWRHRTL